MRETELKTSFCLMNFGESFWKPHSCSAPFVKRMETTHKHRVLILTLGLFIWFKYILFWCKAPKINYRCYILKLHYILFCTDQFLHRSHTAAYQLVFWGTPYHKQIWFFFTSLTISIRYSFLWVTWIWKYLLDFFQEGRTYPKKASKSIKICSSCLWILLRTSKKKPLT